MGFASGFQVGAQAVERGLKMREEDKLKRELAQAYAKPEEFVDYTPEQQRQIQGLQAAGGYDVQAVPGAEGQAPMLRYSARPGSMYYDDMGQPEAPIEVAPQRVQRYGGQTVAGQFDPAQLRGLQMREAARALGASGDVRGAAALEMQAEDFIARAEDRAYQARIRPEQEAQMKRQGLLTEGQISAMRKTQERETKLEAVDTDVAQWQSKRLLDPTTNELRQPTPDDDIAALQYRATALRKAGLAKEATDSLKDYQGIAGNQIKLDETQRNAQLGPVAAAIAAGDLGPAAAFYDRYVLDGAKVTGMKSDPKTGAITVSRVRDDGEPMPDKVIKGGANELLAALNSFKDPTALYTFSQNEFNNNIKTKELDLKTKAEARLAATAAQDRLSPLEKNIATLQKLGISVTPEEVRGMAGIKADKLSPEAAAQIELITASVKDNSTPANIEAARTAVSDIFKGEGLKQRNATIVRGLRTASERNDLPAALTQLQNAGVGTETIAGLARQAGVQLPANFAPAPAALTPAAPAQPIRGLTSNAQPTPYVPPATSRVGRVQAAQAAQTETAAETSRAQATARAQLSTQFAADARTMSPLELVRKYDTVRTQLPTADKLQLQQVERNIR